MKTIWKYPVTLADEFALTMPAGAEILTVQAQYGDPCLWAIVELTAPTETRMFRLVGTGRAFPEAQDESPLLPVYLGTFQLYDGNRVLHLFEQVSARGRDA